MDGEGSVSEITTTSMTDFVHSSPEPPLEVTHEDHLRNVRSVQPQHPATRPPQPYSSSSITQQQQPKRGASRLVSNLMKKNHHGRHRQPKNVLRDSQSVASADGLSLEGVVSLAQTATSHDTLKASNTSSNRTSQSKKAKGRGWNKLKRMMGVAKSDSSDNASGEPSTSFFSSSTGIGIKQARSCDFDAPNYSSKNARARTSESAASVLSNDTNNNNNNNSDRKLVNNRVRSTPDSKTDTVGTSTNVDALEQRIIDDSIRGRRDGIDVIAFGGALTVQNVAVANDDFPKLSFTGSNFDWSPADIMFNMLWNSGSSQPEMILEGFVPGGDDRWSVKMEQSAVAAAAATSTTTTTNGKRESSSPMHDHQDENKLIYDVVTDDDNGSPALPTQELWATLWGPDPAPTRFTDLNKYNVRNNDDATEDPVLLLAAECSVPIDVDEDTFIISAPQHLRAIHDIAAVPLSQGDFELALAIFGKLLKGMDFMENKQLKFLKGTTLHNLAMIYLWQGDYEKALIYFELACKQRVKHLPKNHPDTVVSLVRKGMVLFALERFGEAVAAFEVALPMTPAETLARAKVQSNLGVAYCYHQSDSVAALKQFTMSLEMQRTWLDSSVRREALVLDAAVTLTNMGKLYMERSEWDLASTVYEEALLLRTSILRKDEAIVLDSMTSLAVAKARFGDMKHALQILHSCTKLKNARLGQGSPSSIETIGLMGYLYMKTEKTEDAGRCLSAVKRWQKANLAPDHPSVLQTNAINTVLQESLIEEVWV